MRVSTRYLDTLKLEQYCTAQYERWKERGIAPNVNKIFASVPQVHKSRLRELWEYIDSYAQSHGGNAPTISEMRAALKVRNRNSVYTKLDRLAQLRLIALDEQHRPIVYWRRRPPYRGINLVDVDTL